MNTKIDKNLNIAGRLSLGFINHPLTFIFGAFILALGYISLLVMPREENPQIKVSGGVVIVALPGAKPSEIQKVIIEPLEKKIREIKGVENIYSFAKDSVGIVQVQYFIGENKEESNLKLYDQVMRNMDLMPLDAMQPIIKTMDIDTDIPIATIAFYSQKENNKDLISQTALYNEVSKISKEINKIKDVALVDLKGEKKEQFNVQVDANKLSAYNLSLASVMKQIQSLSYKTPNITSSTQDSSLVVFGIKQAIENVKDLENLIISYNFQTPVYLKDIALIEKSFDIQNKKEALVYIKNEKDEFLESSQVTLSASKLKSTNSVTINENMCIGCGNCIDACTHEARFGMDDIDSFLSDVRSGVEMVAIVAPAAAANFPGKYLKLNTWLKSLGIKAVFDVSFGAELTVKTYLDHVKRNKPKTVIAQPCPAIVTFIELYQPELIEHLAPADSPMLHTVKMIRLSIRNMLMQISP